MSILDLNVSQLPSLPLPVQEADLLHIVRSGKDYRVRQDNLIVAFLSGLQDVDITNPANLSVLKYNSSSAVWENGTISWTEIELKPATFTPSAHLHMWSEITSIPSEFPPEAHTHAWSDLTDVPTTFTPAAHMQDWSTITGVPSEFTPESHTHLWTEITDKPLLFPPEPHDHAVLYYDKVELSTSGAGGAVHWDNVTNKPSLGIGDMLTTDYDPDQDGIVSHAALSDAVAWAGVTGKPATFTPSIHTHLWADITDPPTTFTPSPHTHLWTDITDKPLTFTPSVHTHLWAQITDKPLVFPPETHSHGWTEITDKPTEFPPEAHEHSWTDLFDVPSLFPPDVHSHAWSEITDKPTEFAPEAHTHLWVDITDKPTEFNPSAHTHLWADITDTPTEFAPSAHTHLWADITDKPLTFAPSAHDHDDRYFTDAELMLSGGGGLVHWDNITDKPAFGTAAMAVADYDPDQDGVVNDSDKVAGVAPTSVGLGLLSATSESAQRDALQLGSSALLDAGAANGVATLDNAGKVPMSQLPSSIMEYKGAWNATTNSPTLADGAGDAGDVYRVTVAGTVDLGSGSLTYTVGDYCIYNGTTWEKSDSTDITDHGALVGLTDDDHPQYLKNFAIQIILGNGNDVITPGVFGDMEVPSDGIIEGWTLLEGTGTTGSIAVDIWKDTYANFPPTVADTITGSQKPSFAGAVKGQELSLTGWGSTSIARGQILRFNVDSATSVKQVTLSLRCRRT